MINYRFLQVPYWPIGVVATEDLRPGDRFPLYNDDCDKPFQDVQTWMIVTELTENLVRVECIGEIRDGSPPFEDMPRLGKRRASINSVFRPVIYDEDDE